MMQRHGRYELDDTRQRVDYGLVHAWLTATYWSPGISRERVETGARHSALVMGVYLEATQVGFARVVSDTTRFAYLCDVYVEAAHRGQGLARAMVKFALEHPELAGVSRWFLRTQDAHAVYKPLGFEPISDAEFWMSYTPPGE